MCYSAEASILSFLVSIFISYNLYKRNKNYDRSIALIIFGISTIQIAEFFMHLNYDCNSKMNKYSSLLGLLIILLIQPLFSIISNIYTQNKITKELIIQFILWIIYILYIVFNFWPNSKELCTTKNCKGDCKLTWNWLKTNGDIIFMILYNLIILIIPIYVMYKNNLNKIFMWLFYLIMSVIFIYKNKYFGTLWCFWGPIGAYLLQYYFN